MQKKFKELENGKILLITPEGDEDSNTPLFCRVCEFPMKTFDDTFSFRKDKCCSKCSNRWGSQKQGKLIEGWTPDKDSLEWKEYISERILLGKHLINLK